MRVVGEDRLSARRARARDDPGVAAEVLAGRRGRERPRNRTRRRARPTEPRTRGRGPPALLRPRGAATRLRTGSSARSRRTGSSSRRPPGPDGPTNRARRISSRALPARSQAIIFPHTRLSTGVQGSGDDAKDPELDRSSGIGGQEGVDAGGVRLEGRPRGGGERGPMSLGRAPEADRAEEPVRLDEPGPQDLRQPSRADATLELHLPEPVPRVRVAEAVHRVGDRLRPDRGHAARIRLDPDGRGVAGDTHLPARAGKRPPDQPAGIERRGRDERRKDEKSLPQGVSCASSRSCTRESVSCAVRAPDEAQEHVPLRVPDVALRPEKRHPRPRPRPGPSTTR